MMSLAIRLTVKVGNQVLSTNVYTDTGDRTLMRVEYGNGGKVTLHPRRFPARDGNPATTMRRSRALPTDYGANGQAAYVRDSELNRTVWTEYDTSERPTPRACPGGRDEFLRRYAEVCQ